MRPLRLELSGFTSFREQTTIDFTDADLFVLSGAMGAGKSSIIDALGFALYGAVSRFHNLSVVGPVISQGLMEARVRLDFALGEVEYSAVRVVRRNTRTGGASTPEARLMCGETLLEDNADDVTKRVTRLLGLNFEQFTRCVVLPQGEFAELLHAKPAERQELLVSLLDISLYRRIGERARQRRALSEGTSKLLKERLDGELAGVTDEAYHRQAERVELLTDLLARLQADDETLLCLNKEADEHKTTALAAQTVIAALEAIKVPAGIDDFGRRLDAAQKEQATAHEAALAAAEAFEEAQTQRAGLPERSLIEAAAAKHGQRETLVLAVKTSESRIMEVTKQLAAATSASEKAEVAVTEAEDENRRLEQAHSAYHASRGLKAGDTCPVCGEKLTEAPRLAEPKGMAQAVAALKKARVELQARQSQITSVKTMQARVEQALEHDQRQLRDLEAELAGLPTPDECAELLQGVDAAEEALRLARRETLQANEADTAASKLLSGLQAEEQTAWTRFNAARDPVAAYAAPAAAATVAASWALLATWAAGKRLEQEALRQTAREQEEAARAKVRELEQTQLTLCAEASVEIRGRPVESVIRAATQAQEALKYIDERLAQRISVQQNLDGLNETSRVAGILGLHLNASHFERWYLEEAMTRLVEGATERLADLSQGQYSLGLNHNKTDFVVVDHINANEERPVRTLSGGETFLASLALALALGDDISSLAANGAARLDALFLDEGFGSLDPNTLETVASAIEELGARGRMVGIITHVPELAERLPVQFRVWKDGGTSKVERVAAR